MIPEWPASIPFTTVPSHWPARLQRPELTISAWPSPMSWVGRPPATHWPSASSAERRCWKISWYSRTAPRRPTESTCTTWSRGPSRTSLWIRTMKPLWFRKIWRRGTDPIPAERTGNWDILFRKAPCRPRRLFCRRVAIWRWWTWTSWAAWKSLCRMGRSWPCGIPWCKGR